MNDIVIPEIIISQRELVNAVVLYMVCLGVVIVASKYRKWLKSGLQNKETVYWILAVISIAVFLPAIWETGKIITGQDDIFDGNPNRYMILLAAIIGPPFVIWRTYIAHNQHNTVEQNSITDRIDKAVQHLETSLDVAQGAEAPPEPNLKVRLAAIYSLERIAQESVSAHVKVMGILCDYVRNNSKAESANLRAEHNPASIATWHETVPPAAIDIQAVFDVIARRNDEQLHSEITEKYTLDFHECNLQRINFRKGKFDLAIMDKCHLDFAQMNNTELNGVKLNRATLDGAVLGGARLNGAELNGAKLNETNFDRAELNGAKFNGAALNGALLNRAKLNGAVLVGAELKGANLNGAELNRAVANGANFNKAKLNGSSLKQAVLSLALFNGAELNGADLYRASLNRAVLNGAELNEAKLNEVDFVAAQTKLTAIKAADLLNTIRLSEGQIESMFGDESTILPTEMKRPEGWPKDDLDYSEFYARWQVAKKEAGLP